MDGTSDVSGQNNAPKFDVANAQSDEQSWKVELNNINTDQNGWRVNNTESNLNVQETDILDKNGQFKPEVSQTLNNFIGTMTIEMVKKQSPAQKISMDGDE